MCSKKIDRLSEIIIQYDKVLDSYLKGTFCIENKGTMGSYHNFSRHLDSLVGEITLSEHLFKKHFTCIPIMMSS